ncbi:hypothetical protein GCM10023223_09520 [Stackebrandtia albiflava]
MNSHRPGTETGQSPSRVRIAGRKRRLLAAGGVLSAIAGLLLASTPFAEASTVSLETDTAAQLSFGHPVFTPAEIDAWSSTSHEYTRLAGSWAGNVNRSYASYGAEISSTERDLFRDESGYLKVQAMLWAADGDTARRDKVVTRLNDIGNVISWQADAAQQYRLVAGWSCTNLAQAAAMVDYQDTDFTRFLVQECYPLLDWSNGGNWHASFADSRLAIASYVQDTDLWNDAKAYFNTRIAQSIYHSRYDGTRVRPLLDANGKPSVGLTRNHWGGTWGVTQITNDLSPIDPARFPDGVNAERTRDLGHVSMGLGAWIHGARTILAQGDTLEPHAFDRLLAAYAHHGDRVLAYLDTGEIPEPGTARGDGGNAFKMAWFGACTFFADRTPADPAALCAHDQVTGLSPVGANHLIAEAFAYAA